MSAFKERSRRMKKIIGHRGARELWPENGIMGFRNVPALGLHGVEFDVHPTADGRIAVIHDPTLERTTSGHGAVAAHTADELRRLTLKGGDGEGVPLLDDVLDVLAPSPLELHVEIKADAQGLAYPGFERQVIAAIRERRLAERTVLTSFSPRVLAELRRLRSEGRLLASVNARSAEAEGGLGALLRQLNDIPVDYVAVEKGLLAEQMDVCLDLIGSERLGAWVVNAPADIERWLAAPVTFITTDRPDLVVAANRR
jgi:glycerophosphoryl diester phosphodiesterase